ncbi:50S ribosomal protein L25 [Pseudoclavibacter endophyticus]|uniref:Large ribosomal subunit protein bL25 n=1 Tax=Pseudoclavibacter endophyticus TaxID=1778590 RepID=A0A6H9WTK9_9MICO|nr:50S ribosomal protein L25/general stress protein Ctc [Pseudoclavibacter endophyticus]KAB1649600.1 50S ribosomal protein L25/general stress protein Ctc [Pseudoclavibacter endophyticus]GGA61322.1 50S ribosomal protein L25 [Pseudoclavibacter endophyticus]
MAESQNTLAVEVRTEFGKGAARRVRRADKIPGVLYGHGGEPRHLTLPGHETMLLIRQSNAVVELAFEGESHLALVKDVQRDPIRRLIEHVDFIAVRQGEQVEVDVPVHVTGEPFPGTVALQETTSVLVSAEATHIPESLDVSVEGLEEGAVIHATDLTLPSGVKLIDDESNIIIVSITVPRGEVDDDAEAEAGEATEGGE